MDFSLVWVQITCGLLFTIFIAVMPVLLAAKRQSPALMRSFVAETSDSHRVSNFRTADLRKIKVNEFSY
jgi:hypothetical protein